MWKISRYGTGTYKRINYENLEENNACIYINVFTACMCFNRVCLLSSIELSRLTAGQQEGRNDR